MKHATPLLLLSAVIGFAHAVEWAEAQPAQPATAPSPASVAVPPPVYPIPYAPPTVEGVAGTLGKIMTRLEQNAPIRFVKDGKEVTDVSKVDPGVHLDSGPERKFPPLTYSMGVVYSGLLSVHQETGDQRYADYVAKRLQFFADHYEAMKAWGNGRENPFRNFYNPQNLDACGAVNASFVKARRLKVSDAKVDPIVETAVNYVHTKQMRLEDGTFCRPGPYPQSIWLDDAYMSVPLLANYAALTGKREYFDDAARQIIGFHKHLFVKERGLFTHAGYAANPDNHGVYCWGRANGWFMVATVELLDLLPEDHPQRAAVIDILKAHAKGIASAQSGAGMWHQILDREDSYLETSCTAMFTYGLAKGCNRGWLDPRAYATCAVAGWNGLSTKISADGRVNDVCIGTNYAQDMVYYYHRPAIDDVHGYGAVFLAGSEMIELLKNPKIRINSNRTNANLVANPPRE